MTSEPNAYLFDADLLLAGADVETLSDDVDLLTWTVEEAEEAAEAVDVELQTLELDQRDDQVTTRLADGRWLVQLTFRVVADDPGELPDLLAGWAGALRARRIDLLGHAEPDPVD
jgi:hypothetical protein